MKVVVLVCTRGYAVCLPQENEELKLLEYFDFFGNKRIIDESKLDPLFEVELEQATVYAWLSRIKFEDSRRLQTRSRKRFRLPRHQRQPQQEQQ